jgi:hypothetical protein
MGHLCGCFESQSFSCYVILSVLIHSYFLIGCCRKLCFVLESTINFFLSNFAYYIPSQIKASFILSCLIFQFIWIGLHTYTAIFISGYVIYFQFFSTHHIYSKFLSFYKYTFLMYIYFFY